MPPTPNNMGKTMNKQRGFTLVEAAIAIGVVALLVAFFAIGAGIAVRRPQVTLG